MEYPVEIVYLVSACRSGQWDQSVLHLINGLPKMEFSSRVIGFSSAPQSGEGSKQVEGTCETLSLDRKIPSNHFFELVSALEELQPDIVHSFMNRANAMIRLAASIASVPVYVTTGPDKSDWTMPRYMDYLSQTFVDCEICDSPSTREKERVKSGLSGDQLVTIPSGVDPDECVTPSVEEESLRNRYGIPAGVPLVVVPGRCGGRTSLEELEPLFEALPRILSNHPGLRCVVVGERRDERMGSVLREHEIEDHVMLPGWSETFDTWCAAGDLFVMPVVREYIPNEFLQAVAMDLPYVAPRMESVQDLTQLAQQSGGLLVEPDSPRSLASSVETVLKDFREFTLRAEKFGRLIRRKFTISKFVSRHRALYLDLLQ